VVTITPRMRAHRVRLHRYVTQLFDAYRECNATSTACAATARDLQRLADDLRECARENRDDERADVADLEQWFRGHATEAERPA